MRRFQARHGGRERRRPGRVAPSQAGTPEVRAETKWDETASTFALTLTQTVPDTPGQTNKKPVLMPIAVGLVAPDGSDMPLRLVGEEEDGSSAETTKVLRFSEASRTFVFAGVTERPTPSILRNFSAPVKLTTDLTAADLIFLAANDSDGFNRWEAGQTLMLQRSAEAPLRRRRRPGRSRWTARSSTPSGAF